MGQVPALVMNGETITQSMAILEFLEESFPDKTKLLPNDRIQRAKVTNIKFLGGTHKMMFSNRGSELLLGSQ